MNRQTLKYIIERWNRITKHTSKPMVVVEQHYETNIRNMIAVNTFLYINDNKEPFYRQGTTISPFEGTGDMHNKVANAYEHNASEIIEHLVMNSLQIITENETIRLQKATSRE